MSRIRIGATNGTNRKAPTNNRNTCPLSHLHTGLRANDVICPICSYPNGEPEEGTRKDSYIETIQSPVPIIAKRRINISGGPGGPRLETGHGEIDWVTEAQCSLFNYKTLSQETNTDHIAPDPNCQCGIYAVPLDGVMESNYGSVEAVVELYGRVIEHENGYRAQWQRILELKFFGCWMCGDDAYFFDLVTGQTRCNKKFHKPIRSYKSMWVTIDELMESLKKSNKTQSNPESEF